MPHRVYLSLGSNLGDRRGYLRRAIDALPPPVRVLRLSPLYETAPWGYLEQDDFLNIVVEAETVLQPLELLEHLKSIEALLGRTTNFRFGPREIDLDILFYDDLILAGDRLTIPHPRLHERAFALVPLADLAPELVHPQLDQTVTELLAAIPDAQTFVRKVGPLDPSGGSDA